MRTKSKPKMSSNAVTLAVEETEVLQIIRDYLEESGRAECLVALETGRLGVGPPQTLPAEIRFLRELILAGRWDNLATFMEPLSRLQREDGEFRNCQYVLLKQQYLESLVGSGGRERGEGQTENMGVGTEELWHSRKLQHLKAHLESIQPLCPTKEDYSNLLYLLTLPSLTADEGYRNWTVDGSRLQCFYEVGQWVAKVLYPGFELTLDGWGSGAWLLASNRLIRLLSKGLLYEECEALCLQRADINGNASDILDLGGWMRHQPDSAFQLPPSRLSLVLVPHLGPGAVGKPSALAKREANAPGRVASLSTSVTLEQQDPASLSYALRVQPGREGRGLLSRSVPEMPASEYGREEEEGKLFIKVLSDRANARAVVTDQAKAQEVDVPLLQKQSLWQKDRQEPPPSLQAKQDVSGGETTGPCEPPGEEEVDVGGGGIGAIGSDPEAHQLPFIPPAIVGDQSQVLPPSTSSDSDLRTSLAGSKRIDQPKPALTQNSPAQGTMSGSSKEELSAAPPSPPPPKGTKITAFAQPISGGIKDNVTRLQTAAQLSQVTPTSSTTPFNSHLQGHPNSSTPKPFSSRPPLPHPSLPSSPVPYVPGTHGLTDTPHREMDEPDVSRPTSDIPPEGSGDEGRTRARKQIDFSVSNVSVDWPGVTLLCSVTDQQVVRSVAFSQSGEVVAVGANSKVLRLCSTTPLLQENPSTDELAVFYHHPRYHRGSIYCLAWLGDSLLASGSNDQTIKLLSHNPLSPSPCSSLGQLACHKGTIRDLVFLPDGLLASGGAGDCTLKISDCNSNVVVSSYPGHTDQIHAVSVVSDTVLATGGQDKTMKLWDTRQQKCSHTFNFAHVVASLSSNSRRGYPHLASAQTDGSCTIHDLRILKQLGTIHPHADECRSVRFSPSGKWLLSGGYGGNVCLTDVASLEWKVVANQGEKVIQCRWHSSGRLFASTGVDQKACFWALQ